MEEFFEVLLEAIGTGIIMVASIAALITAAIIIGPWIGKFAEWYFAWVGV